MKYLLNKIAFFLITLWVAMTINFMLPRLMPGNPAIAMIARYKGRISIQALHSIEVAFGLNVHQNIFQQYISYIGRTLTFNFGTSLVYYPLSVSEEIAIHMPWTIGLMGITTVISFIAGTWIGVKAAWRRNSPLSSSSVVISLFLNSVPYFWIALLFQYIFGFVLGWFPISGAYSITQTGGLNLIVSILYHAILPSLTIFITSMGGWILTMRNNMIDELSSDYSIFAYAKGLPEKRIEYNYVARNAILPNFTQFAMAIGFIVSGALLTEMVFSYPGIGYVLYQSVIGLDYPLMQALFFFITLSVLVANFIMDLLYILVDPRVRVE